MRIHPTNTSATTAAEFAPIGNRSLSIFPLQQLTQELITLRDALALPEHSDVVDIENDEWQEFMQEITTCLGPLLETDTCSALAHAATHHQLAALAQQIHRALAAVEYAQQTVDQQSSPTGALLPAQLPQRIEVLLGQATLPLAWVRSLDLLAFESDNESQ